MLLLALLFPNLVAMGTFVLEGGTVAHLVVLPQGREEEGLKSLEWLHGTSDRVFLARDQSGALQRSGDQSGALQRSGDGMQ